MSRFAVRIVLTIGLAGSTTAGRCFSANGDTTGPEYGAPSIKDLVAPTSAVEADGNSVSQVSVTLVPGTSDAERIVVFSTTAGQFSQPGGTPATSVRVTADASNKATVILRAPSAPTSAIVTASAGTTVLQQIVNFTVSQGGVLSLTVSDDSVPADGATPITVTAKIPQNAAGAARSVTFSATLGTLGGASASGTITVAADDGGTAIAVLKAATEVGLGVVTAAANGIAQQKTVEFAAARPDRIDLEPDSFVVKAGLTSRVVLTAFLRRNVGVVSRGLDVKFEAKRSDGTTIGRFGAPAFNEATRAVSATFTLADANYRGPVRITARTDGASDREVDAQIAIEVVP